MATEKGLFIAAENGSFVPYDDEAVELHKGLRARKDPTKPVFMSVRSPRNPEFSALAHVVFSKIADAIGVPMDAVKAYLKERTGRFDVVKMPDGSFLRLRHSVAFHAMGEEQFRAFWNDALPIIYEELLGGVNSQEYKDIVEVINGRQG